MNNHNEQLLQPAIFEPYEKRTSFEKLATKFKHPVPLLKYYNLWAEQVPESQVMQHKDINFAMGQTGMFHAFIAKLEALIGDAILYVAKYLTILSRGAV